MQKNQRLLSLFKFLIILLGLSASSSISSAACGTSITWQANANTVVWNTTNNWNTGVVPANNTQTAFIVSDWQIPALTVPRTLSCLEINSGSMTVPASGTLTIANDYFRNLNSGSLLGVGASTFNVTMSGTATQSFENVDTIPGLTISNATTVNLTKSFIISNAFTISAGAGNINIQGDLEVRQTTAVTIPSSAIVTVSAGKTFKLNGGITINGTLKLMPGARLLLANGRTLSVGSTGILQIAGTAGNAAIIDSYNSSSTYTFNVVGKIDAKYFSVSHMTAAGINVTGTIQDLSNGDINSIPNAGYGVTLGAASSIIPSTLSGLGFYGPSGTPLNFNATSFPGSAITVSNWSGQGGATYETDPGNKITWGSAAGVSLLLTNNSPSGAPPSTIARSSAYTQFATFAFALSGASTASDITSIKFTIDGTNANSDISGIKIYQDADNNCVYNAGVDAQVGSILTPSGTPGTVTASFSAGQIQVSSTAQRCVHVLLATSATAGIGNTIGIKIASTDDIVNSQSYALSNTSGPPVAVGNSTVTGTAVSRWNGGNGTVMAQANNWTPNGIPNNTLDCQIGSGYSVPIMAGTFSCANTTFQSGGSINWNSTANAFQFYGALTMASSYTFTTATSGILRAAGTSAQSVYMNSATFPGNFEVTNTTGPVTFESSGTITGNLTLSGGTTRIASGVTLTVSGNISIASGATLDIDPGATLIMANTRTITVSLGGTLEMVGTSGSTSAIQAVNNASTYTIAVSGGIKAQYYSLKNLGLTGLTINSGATIDATYHLQNGSLTYPGVNSAILLTLLRQVPTNTLDSMTFDLGGSTATGVKSISTNTTAGTLTMTNYAGSLTGNTYSTSVNYIVTWSTPTNTLDLTQEAIAPASVNQGAVVNMGRFGLKQTNAGSFSNTDITYIRITMTGTATASDVDYVSLYFDSACSGTGGTLVATQTFTGSPARSDFSSITGATIPFSLTTPPKRCFYVTYSMSSLATNGATVGFQINSSSHMTNSQGYLFNGSSAPPVSMGTASIVGTTTNWTGTTNTAWATASNWSSGVPTSAMNCIINSAANNPIISTGVATCNTMTIGTGTLTMTGGSLELYGSLNNTGTFTQGGFPLTIRDNGTVATSQSINSSSTLTGLSFNKTAGGSVSLTGTLNVTSLITMPVGSNFTFNIDSSKTLSAAGGMTINAGTLSVNSGGTLEIGSAQTLTLSGGTLATVGTNDAYPQSLSNKGTLTRKGSSGTWNFTATSGTLNLVGFVFDWLGINGLNIGGTTSITQINGGQLRDLPTTVGMKAIQFNNSGSLPSTISNFGWYWGSGNSPPAEATVYYLAASTGCGSRTVSFDQWFGDFWPYTSTNTSAKISQTACTILINKANSPVSLTEFSALPYDGKVVLNWTTGLEWLHRGFNVYRSLSPNSGYTQINTQLIRNDLFTTNIHGTYAFIDEDVANNTTYYYKLEDISNTDERTLHGPVSAAPNAAYGTPPPPLANTIVSNSPTGSQSTGGSPPGTSTPGLTQLETNVTLVAKTASSYRLKITIPSYQLSAHPTHPAYQQLSIPLYNRNTTPGSPELLSRTLMLKIPQSSSAQYTLVSDSSATAGSLQIAPAPDWVVVSGNYQEQWSLDSVVYATDAFAPVAPISLGSIVNQNGQYYLPVVIQPLSYNPYQQQLKKYSELIVDIFLDGHTSWAPDAPLNLTKVWGNEGGLKIGLGKDGVFNLYYDDMVTAGVVEPFNHVNINRLKLFIGDQEQPIDVISSNATFDSGDSIRFFARNIETPESKNSYALLVADHSSSSDGLRMLSVDKGNLLGIPTTQNGFSHKVHIEQNNIAIFNEPFSETLDHFVWGLYYGISGGASSPLNTDIQIPSLLPNTNVTIHALVKSRSTTSTNYQHNIRLFVNSSPTANAEVTFDSVDPQSISFTVPSSAFVSGLNRLTLEPTGSLLINGEYDMVYIDSIDVYYSHDWVADNDQILLLNSSTDVDITVGGFSSNDIYGYDISQQGNIQKLTNLNVQFSDSYYVTLPTAGDITYDRRIWLSTESQLVTPTSLQLIYGSNLKDTNNEGQILYIGASELLDAAEPLAVYRETQGYKTRLIELDSIYNEFGLGVHSTDAIRDFINYAHNYWTVKPQYVIFLGSGTYDPKAYQHDPMPLRFPIKFIKGSSFDYASDHWYVTANDSDSDTALAVVARIPAHTPAEMIEYVNKVLAYEAGDSRPSATAMTLIADKPHYGGEDFDSAMSELKTSISSWSAATPVQTLSRLQVGDSIFKTQIQDSFSQSSVIHFMGHGAENMWADNTIFTTNDVDNLTNTKLPIVAAMNCLNANFYDPSLTSLAEKLVMKKSGGAIAFWGSTSITPPGIQSVYQKAFYERLLGDKTSAVGDVVKISKAQAELQSPYKDATYSWTIIGDPLVKATLADPAATPSAATSSGGSSNGCSLFAGSIAYADNPPWDLICAFFLESLIAFGCIQLIRRYII